MIAWWKGMSDLLFCRIVLIFLIFFYFQLKKQRTTRLSESTVGQIGAVTPTHCPSIRPLHAALAIVLQ